MSDSPIEVRKAFGMLFVMVSVAVFFGAIFSEMIFLGEFPFYFYPIVWITSFGGTFGIAVQRFKKSFLMIRHRMKNSTMWSSKIKAINGVCWAMPFLLIAVFPSITQFLILLGIGLGNISTYLFMKKFSNQDNREQLIISVLALTSLPIAIFMESSITIDQDLAIMISRILIAISYGTGGVYALKSSQRII